MRSVLYECKIIHSRARMRDFMPCATITSYQVASLRVDTVLLLDSSIQYCLLTLETFVYLLTPMAFYPARFPVKLEIWERISILMYKKESF